MEKSYKFRLYPNKEQAILLQKTFGCVRFVYNHFLFQRKELYETTGNSIGYVGQSKLLTQLKKELPWLQEPDKFALQNALKNLDAAYRNFFRNVSTGKAPGYPRFKRKHDNCKSYKTNGNIAILDKAVKLPKLGLVECRVSRPVEGRILSGTVSQEPSGKYFISICCTDVEMDRLPSTGQAAGIDMGLTDFAVTSDGDKYPNHKYLAKSEKKLAKLQRRLSRKQKGSKRREKARIKVARCHEHIRNQRRDASHKLSTELVRKYDIIAVEHLSPANMVKNHNLAKSISDASWAEFRHQLEYKADWYGKDVIAVNRFWPSSQFCSNCGARWRGTKDLHVREWTCWFCGHHHDRDINAAQNLINEVLCQFV